MEQRGLKVEAKHREEIGWVKTEICYRICKYRNELPLLEELLFSCGIETK